MSNMLICLCTCSLHCKISFSEKNWTNIKELNSLSFDMWHRIVTWYDTDVSEGFVFSILRFFVVVTLCNDMVGYQRLERLTCLHLHPDFTATWILTVVKSPRLTALRKCYFCHWVKSNFRSWYSLILLNLRICYDLWQGQSRSILQKQNHVT